MKPSKDEIIRQMRGALEELLAEHNAEPWDHEGPWFGRKDTAGTIFAQDALERAKGVA